MQRKPGESIQELAARIRQDAITCDFSTIKDPQDEVMCTRFICSVNNEAVLKAVFKEQGQDLTFAKAIQIDVTEQYGRRQNLEFKGVPVAENENVTNTVIEISKLPGVEIRKSDIFTAHPLATKHPKNGAASSVSPAIIARFVRRDIRNEIYNRRKTAKTIQSHQHPVPGMTKLYVNENLTQYRKKLLWKTKELTKKYHYAYLWTTNGKIFVKKMRRTNQESFRVKMIIKNWWWNYILRLLRKT